MSHTILAVDDEPDVLELVRLNLAQAGFDVKTAATGAEALEQLRSRAPDLVLLDLMLPDYSGTELCRMVRADPNVSHVPIIMLTAKSGEIDRVLGFELGADDYVTKPFSSRELVLRVQAVLRRRTTEPVASEPLRHGYLSLDPQRYRCTVDGEPVDLTAKEFALLSALMSKPGRVLSRQQLLQEVWGSDIRVTSRTIDTHLKRIREKLGRAGSYIGTVRGVGYRFTD